VPPHARATAYQPRDPTQGALHQLLRQHFETYLAARHARPPPPFVVKALRSYLTCAKRAAARVPAMPPPVRTRATFFATGFNTTVAQPTGVSPSNDGDAVALRLAVALREAGHRAAEPCREDWGWRVAFSVGDGPTGWA
jgi:hypothetical protein